MHGSRWYEASYPGRPNLRSPRHSRIELQHAHQSLAPFHPSCKNCKNPVSARATVQATETLYKQSDARQDMVRTMDDLWRQDTNDRNGSLLSRAGSRYSQKSFCFLGRQRQLTDRKGSVKWDTSRAYAMHDGTWADHGKMVQTMSTIDDL